LRASAEVNGACSLGLALNQAANVQLTLVLEGKIMTQMRAMKMVDKDGMITKKGVAQ
jgi:hypothetical protein